jgi:hypothetical protein
MGLRSWNSLGSPFHAGLSWYVEWNGRTIYARPRLLNSYAHLHYQCSIAFKAVDVLHRRQPPQHSWHTVITTYTGSSHALPQPELPYLLAEFTTRVPGLYARLGFTETEQHNADSYAEHWFRKDPGQDLGQSSGQSLGKRPDRNLGGKPGRNQRRNPGEGLTEGRV